MATVVNRARIGASFRYLALPQWWPAPALLVVAFAIRWPSFGRADLSGFELDAQLYLLIGDRVLHGAWPAVDIWDRKPPGLFLIYAFARLFGGLVLPYQLLATGAVWIGAMLVWRLARRGASDGAGFIAGIAYIAWLQPLAGDGGQSPVFYNPLIAGAALLAARSGDTVDLRRIMRLGIAAAALGGVTLQIKYTALPEAAAIAAWCLWRLHGAGGGPRRVMATACAMAVAGLAPTLLVAAFYAVHGSLAAFWYADILSIFDRGHLPPDMVRGSAIAILFTLSPLLLFAGTALWKTATRDRSFIIVWLAGSALGVAMIGNFYIHYALPIVTPLVCASASLFRRTRLGFIAAELLILSPLVQAHWPTRPPQTDIAALTNAIRPYIGGNHCLFVYDGSPLLYLTTGSCLPSRIVSPDHFANAVEAPALGLDIAAETARVLATKPGAIVTTSGFIVPLVNIRTYRMVSAALARDYVRVAAIPGPDRTYYVDVPRDRPHPPGSPAAAMTAPLPRQTVAATRSSLGFP